MYKVTFTIHLYSFLVCNDKGPLEMIPLDQETNTFHQRIPLFGQEYGNMVIETESLKMIFIKTRIISRGVLSIPINFSAISTIFLI